MSETLISTVHAVLTGNIQPYGPHGKPSAINKKIALSPQAVSFNGFLADEQGDTRHHGGLEKALHHYPLDHYSYWRDVLHTTEAHAVLAGPGAFGENLSTLGMTEDNVMIGDRYRIGTVIVEVSQGRQPCWKLNVRFGAQSIAREVQQTLRTGWYYRVIEEGVIGAGDSIVLLERSNPDWSLARILRALYIDVLDREALAAIAAIPHLADNWRTLVSNRLLKSTVEDWASRTETPN